MSVDALTGRVHSEIHSDKNEVAKMLRDDRRVLETGEKVFIPEEPFLAADGLTHYLQTIKIPFNYAETGERTILGIAVDITERKTVEKSRRKASDLLRRLVMRDAHDAITVQDLDGRTLAWNPGAVSLYGWSEAQALQMNVRERIPEPLREGALATLASLSHAEVLQPDLTQRLTQSGAVLEVSIISTALLDEAGKMYAIATTERATPGGQA